MGLFASKDESKEEVFHLNLHIWHHSSSFPASQFDKFLAILSEKPFAAKVASKYYPNMYVIYLPLAPETHRFPLGPTAGLLLVEISRTLRTRKSTRTSTPGLPLSSRMCSLERSTKNKTNRYLAEKLVQ